MRNLFIVLGLMVSVSMIAVGQPLPTPHHTELDRTSKDTNTLQHILRGGTFYGHARYFFMGTDNKAGLSDYFANAIGMGIGYETGKIKGFQLGLSGFFIYNIGSSDLSVADPKTGALNRYEIGLFDMKDPKNHHDLDRLEDLYLKYSFKKSNVKFGKQHIKTPYVNAQDGRMRPTLTEGVTIEFKEIKNTTIEAGYLYKISPRGTVKWYGVGESIGIYPMGVLTDGTRANYEGRIKSDGIIFTGITHSINKNVKLQAWNNYVENVFNTTLLQYNGDYKIANRYTLITGLQGAYQTALNHGGHAEKQYSYMLPNNQVYTFGAKLGIALHNQLSFVGNYNRITKHGQYLMPREWGRDPFFTFMARERNEGLGDVHAITGTLSKKFAKKGLKIEATYGYFKMPDVKNFALNKYGLPSYWQTNIDIRYIMPKYFHGTELQLLYVYKGKVGETYNNERFVMNKVDMSTVNFIVNYHF